LLNAGRRPHALKSAKAVLATGAQCKSERSQTPQQYQQAHQQQMQQRGFASRPQSQQWYSPRTVYGMRSPAAAMAQQRALMARGGPYQQGWRYNR